MNAATVGELPTVKKWLCFPRFKARFAKRPLEHCIVLVRLRADRQELDGFPSGVGFSSDRFSARGCLVLSGTGRIGVSDSQEWDLGRVANQVWPCDYSFSTPLKFGAGKRSLEIRAPVLG